MKRSLLTVALLPVVACQGSDPGAQNPGSLDALDAVIGSYDVVMADVEAVGDGADFPLQSQGLSLRLDIWKNDAGAYEGQLTPRWGAASAVRVDVGLLEVKITSSGTPMLLAGQYYDKGEPLRELKAPRKVNGPIDGAFTGTGELLPGPSGQHSELSFAGSVKRDTTPPEVRLEPAGGPYGKRLPWDPLTVKSAEGINGAGAALIARGRDGRALPIVWDDEKPERAGRVEIHGSLGNWDVDGALDLLLSKAIQDPSGNQLGAFQGPFDVLTVGPPVAEHGFEKDGDTFARWGAVATPGDAVADPVCADGGCAAVGPFHSIVCDDTRIGLAGRLLTDGATKITFRYRVVQRLPRATADLYDTPPPFRFELTTPGGAIEWVDLRWHFGEVHPVDVQVAGHDWGTDWETLTVPIPAGTHEYGFALHAGFNYPVSYCDGTQSPPSPSVDSIVLLDSVAAVK
jgi:hypothetical protein